MVRWFELSDDPASRAGIFLVQMEDEGYVHFDSTLRGHLKLISVEADEKDPKIARSVFELTCDKTLCNATGNLHGGAVALVFDMCTSVTVAPVAKEGFWDTGHVSRTLNCTYLRPAPEGTVLLVESEIVHLGNSMGMVRGVMRRKDNGLVCYTCEHGKARVMPPKL